MDMIDIILTVIRTSAIDVNNPDHKGRGARPTPPIEIEYLHPLPGECLGMIPQYFEQRSNFVELRPSRHFVGGWVPADESRLLQSKEVGVKQFYLETLEWYVSLMDVVRHDHGFSLLIVGKQGDEQATAMNVR